MVKLRSNFTQSASSKVKNGDQYLTNLLLEINAKLGVGGLNSMLAIAN
ncbi:argonaute 4 [Corchorus olitorius]|uniref:Argonaute 4 n=1 Tax=Corchorus olitorius TaxID=93759 RepID=A0A1R3G4P2_9ROSI|nr:argonaute 4 [Corchorus olitorius]